MDIGFELPGEHRTSDYLVEGFMLENTTQISGHTVHIDSSETRDGWKVELTSSDRRTFADGYGDTEAEAYENAVDTFKSKVN